MKVTIQLSEKPRAELVFEEGVREAGPAGTFFKVTQELKEERRSGLILTVAGAVKHTWVPASTIRRVEVVE